MENRKKPPFAVFLSATVIIFFLSLSAAESVEFVPCYIDGTPCGSNVALSSLPELSPESGSVESSEISIAPERILIPAIDLDLLVQNPATRDITALDELLKNGPARFVDSALLGESGNVLIFAHSSHLPIVHNQMYKAFNRIPELKAGDTITLQGDGRSFVYNVTSVRTADAEEDIISLSKNGQKLTLVTCDTLTGKTARFIVEAEFIATL